MSTYACPKCGNLNRVGAKFCGRCGTAITAPLDIPAGGHETGRLSTNSLIHDRYVIVRTIGQGGMGAVYLATDTLDQNRVVAVKEMSNAAIPDANDRQRSVAQFQHEAQLLRRLRHPNLPVVSDEFVVGDRNYLVMEYVPGSTLQQMLSRGEGPFAENRVVAWTNQLCDVLDYLHRQQPPIIFRDLKPGNIMIMADDRLKLIDFGIARLFKPGQRQDTMLLGTQGYAAPEQYGMGQSDARSDIYALGATLFSLLTGQDPGQLSPLKPLPPVRSYRPDISPELETVILRATRMNAAERWQSTQELRHAIASGPLPTTERSPTPPPPPLPSPSAPTHRVTTRLLMRAARLSTGQLALAGLGLLALVVAAIFRLTQPLYQMRWIWNNVPFWATVGPFAYAATRRRFVGGLAHAIVVPLGQRLVLDQIERHIVSVPDLVLGAVASAAVLEGMIALLPRVLGKRTRDAAGAWQREAGWLGLASVLAYIALQWPANDLETAFKVVAWAFAFLLGAGGWFLGDLVQGYVYLKQTGVHWR
ncbi:MAG: protein kinase [Candidatus Promineofilum sp.]|nr:protein kinase [Promineifilum sp.]MCW5863719.1 protein kinase [Anaerolineae bacterium]